MKRAIVTCFAAFVVATTAHAAGQPHYADLTLRQARAYALHDVIAFESSYDGRTSAQATNVAKHDLGQLTHASHAVCHGRPFWRLASLSGNRGEVIFESRAGGNLQCAEHGPTFGH